MYTLLTNSLLNLCIVILSRAKDAENVYHSPAAETSNYCGQNKHFLAGKKFVNRD